jgi:hypothetical protein
MITQLELGITDGVSVSLVSINVWRLVGDTLNITHFLYCNHQVHRDFLIILQMQTAIKIRDVPISDASSPSWLNFHYHFVFMGTEYEIVLCINFRHLAFQGSSRIFGKYMDPRCNMKFCYSQNMSTHNFVMTVKLVWRNPPCQCCIKPEISLDFQVCWPIWLKLSEQSTTRPCYERCRLKNLIFLFLWVGCVFVFFFFVGTYTFAAWNLFVNIWSDGTQQVLF